ncbi:hypothetical protein ABZ389_19200, partial [Streptomyces sp. NPDC005877]
MSELQREVSELEKKSATAARLFDIRRIIGGLFTLYGVIVTIAGLTASDADLDKAQGVNINLWTGLGVEERADVVQRLLVFRVRAAADHGGARGR